MAKITVFSQNHSEPEIAYLAGIIDGEGCFYMGHVKQGRYGSGYQFHTTIKVDNTNRALIDYLNTTFGGTREYSYWKNNPKHKPVYAWYAAGMMLDYLCPRILPYLIIKKENCEVMIKMRETYKNIPSGKLSEETINKRIELINQNRKLNTKGNHIESPK